MAAVGEVQFGSAEEYKAKEERYRLQKAEGDAAAALGLARKLSHDVEDLRKRTERLEGRK